VQTSAVRPITMSADADALIVGAGPAGASTAIRLATAGWYVILIEQHSYPRHKVCGECIAAGSWALLDELGVGSELRHLAGPDLRQVGWMSAEGTLVARMPACPEGPYRYGRALGRDYLDAVLLERARSLGVRVLQPAKLLEVSGAVGRFDCRYELRSPHVPRATQWREQGTLRATVVIDAHGSWERELVWSGTARGPARRLRRSDSELLAFKASYQNAKLPRGLLPVIAFNGGYGGMVMADHARTTLACCIRRDALESFRRDAPGETAGAAIEAYLRRTCHGIAEALSDAQRDGSWLSVGPIRPGVRVDAADPILRVGNAAGEAHPLIGEGIGMALKSAALLAAQLGPKPAVAYDWKHFDRTRRTYAAAWRHQFASRLRIAQLYAHIAMNPTLSLAAHGVITRLPQVLTFAARMAGKARPAPLRRSLN
jgi:2-polyprenyl-6-methoxyphenol hydroxylase-like FAD-dependent oxidoreductase